MILFISQQNKKCNKCGAEKPLTEFTKDKNFKEGYRPQCKQCRSTYQVKWKNKNRAKWLSIRKKTRKKNQKSENLKKTLRHSKNKNNLSEAYLKRLIRRKYNIRSNDVPIEMLHNEKQYIEIKRKIQKFH